MDEIDFFKGCSPRTQTMIKMLVNEFNFSPMGFDVNLSKKLQRKGHQDIYYMGKKISNNRLTRVLESRWRKA